MTTVPGRSAPGTDTIRHHPDQSADFHRLLLGPTMVYSGGYWEDGEGLTETLDEAQERKLDRFVELAGAAGARRVLDVGCGWGTMLNRLTVVHGVERAVGLTLSRAQQEFITGFGNPRISARLESWADHAPRELYDAAFCVNALEHFVPYALGPRERAEMYGAFFGKVGGALRPGARFVLHTITVGGRPAGDRLLDDLRFLRHCELHDAHIPQLHELARAADDVFDIVEIVNERESFAVACRAWLERLARCRDIAVVLAGEESVARVERCLGILAATLEDKYFSNLRVTLARR
ncbi:MULTISPECIES: SAM-dependent methyltransferase [unclassified Streptomyces]|uniref:SAM-dependent methyltransferase n=1 Tax=unclassified Streptomyces TaxID=2593676 RepID=UPI00380822CF